MEQFISRKLILKMSKLSLFLSAPSSPPTDFTMAPADNDQRTLHLMWMPPVQPNGALTGISVNYIYMNLYNCIYIYIYIIQEKSYEINSFLFST